MSELAALQRGMLDAIFREEAAEGGLEVYRRTVAANLAGALRETYPVTRRLVGDAFFAEAARRFALERPSRSGDLHEFGGALAAFLEAYAPARPLAYLPDVARLEWSVHESRHAADAAPLDFAALARVPAERQGALRFTLHPSVRLVSSAHPVCAIWHANQPQRDGTLEGDGGAQCALVWREDLAVSVEAVEPAEFAFLSLLANGATFDAACASMGDAEVARLAAPALARYATRAIVTGFE
jgi:hypothetical protein